jgi:hypothetical protein
LWTTFYPSGTWRYKITVTVETPEGIKTGSAVREVSVYSYPTPFPEDSGAQVRVAYGEAVVVDLGERGVLFALLNGAKLGVDYGHSLPFYIFPSSTGGTTAAGIRHYRNLKTSTTEIAPEWYPTFVHFKDINNRKTAEPVMEMEPCTNPKTRIPRSMFCIKEDRFVEIYGEGVRLESVTVEMTTEPVTKGIVDKYLPWLEPWRAEQKKLPIYTTVNPTDWAGAENPEFAQTAIGGLKREGL